MSHRKTTKKRSTVRHTRAIQRDRRKRPLAAPPDAHIEVRLRELLLPAIEAERAHFKALGLRERHLPLLVLVVIVISLIWRQLGSSGSEIARLLKSEGLLWGCLQPLIPVLQARAQARQCPLPPWLAWVQTRYTAVLTGAGSTLDALLCQVGLSRRQHTRPLAGKLFAVLDVCTHLPRALWYTEAASTHDQQFWEHLLHCVPAGALLLLDLGFTNFTYSARLTFCTFITRAKSNFAYEIVQVWQQTNAVRDYLVWVGQGDTRQQLRLVLIWHAGGWYRYLTNELDPQRLPAGYVANLYRQR